jgi:hypothetical protein
MIGKNKCGENNKQQPVQPYKGRESEGVSSSETDEIMSHGIIDCMRLGHKLKLDAPAYVAARIVQNWCRCGGVPNSGF